MNVSRIYELSPTDGRRQEMTDAEKIAFINFKMFECMLEYSDYWKNIWDRERMKVLARMPDKRKVMMYDRNVNRGYGLAAWTVDFWQEVVWMQEEGIYQKPER